MPKGMKTPKGMMMSQLIVVVVAVTNFVTVIEGRNRQQGLLMLLFVDLNALGLRLYYTFLVGQTCWDL
jgi:hypothetical protein